jgi:hypothetical protein
MRRLRRGEWLAAAGGLALLGFMWAPWYGDANAWSAFAVVDVLLALAAVAGISTAVLQATRRSPALSVFADVIASTIGLLALLVLVFRVLDPPEAGARAWGAAAGFVSCLVLVAGAWLAMRDE